jgi:hypothetical protein
MWNACPWNYANANQHLTFVYPCIVSIIVNDDQQDATILAYLFIPNQLYMFWAVFTHHQEHLTVFPADRTDLPSYPWRRPVAVSVDNMRSCKYSQVLLMMGEDIVRNM